MDIGLIGILLVLAQALWCLLVALLAAAAIALAAGARARYVLLVASCSCAATLSLAWIVLVRVVDSLAVGAMVDALGPWVVLVASHVIEPTAWPAATLACSVCGMALGIVALRRKRAQQGPWA
ncbi:hypothetical protein [Arabiibacter massiliensis]|uniref:hypothetical protein n=1 Tax=Arabiibacter massiliensis TaxID=1870985 RepID=UPI0009B9507D|nr:hypothetical protein [Arabiibacter massiliensis]